ncbi:GNAT family N-acetyltransferase [Promethearchaeum syntrophicum]|uniref:GNAT family N-acetyltransferase n=1 Tax=Promethearchaeum syntrophicum TaxID=2594042 RepID=A0A5B9DC16_9ARCH|nr:GNAT family N-acetyltransferase [Candidatus Prometheoarchaeum syntrophicum]
MAKKKKNTAGKVDEHYWDSMDLLSDNDREEYYSSKSTSSKATTMKNEALHDEKSEFQGKLRKIFFPEEYKTPQKEEYEPKDYVYIQMKLNIENLPKEFLKELDEFRVSGISIRECDEDCLPIFVKLYNRSFMLGSDPYSPATEEQFRVILKDETTVVLIGSKSGEDVGFIIIDIFSENESDERDIGVIAGLGTDPRWQRQGIGRYLGIASWDYFRKKFNLKELRCEVYEKNLPSYNLIKSLHFEEYGKKSYKF